MHDLEDGRDPVVAVCSHPRQPCLGHVPGLGVLAVGDEGQRQRKGVRGPVDVIAGSLQAEDGGLAGGGVEDRPPPCAFRHVPDRFRTRIPGGLPETEQLVDQLASTDEMSREDGRDRHPAHPFEHWVRQRPGGDLGCLGFVEPAHHHQRVSPPRAGVTGSLALAAVALEGDGSIERVERPADIAVEPQGVSEARQVQAPSVEVIDAFGDVKVGSAAALPTRRSCLGSSAQRTTC